jgi:hypothetical protein
MAQVVEHLSSSSPSPSNNNKKKNKKGEVRISEDLWPLLGKDGILCWH